MQVSKSTLALQTKADVTQNRDISDPTKRTDIFKMFFKKSSYSVSKNPVHCATNSQYCERPNEVFQMTHGTFLASSSCLRILI